MTPRWIIDTNNVVGSRPDGWWRDRQGALLRLLDEIIRWRAVTGEPVLMVVDGHPTGRVPEGSMYGVEVRYARSTAPDAADDDIVRIVSAHPDAGTVTVVTSDRRLRQRVMELGARAEGAQQFLRRIADTTPRPRT